MNGDGFADLLFGWTTINVPGDPDRISLYLGGPGDPTLAWTYEDDGLVRSDFTGVGRLDPDGFDDLVFVADPDRLLVFHGASPAPAATPDQVVSTPFIFYQQEIRPLGDMDGDGHADLAVGGTNWSLLRGSAAGLRRSPSWDRHHAYSDVATAGDVNGDGRAELLFGSYDGELDDGADGGSVELLEYLP